MEENNGITKEAAIEACKKGAKIAHKYFSSDEWVEFRNGSFYTEDGCNMGGLYSEFWTIRTGGCWETGWRIVG